MAATATPEKFSVIATEMKLAPITDKVRAEWASREYHGASPEKCTSRKDCMCKVNYTNYIYGDSYGGDVCLYCPKCGCLKDILGS